jgi:mannose-6-phosphate isomerase-like protein (cupin superfamily)
VRHLSVGDLRALGAGGNELYKEWLRVPAMSSGLYVLGPGQRDPQTPHREDEVYVVLAGQARFTGGPETTTVGPGSVIFVPADEAHFFHDVTGQLEVVVIFAPAETG